MKRQTSGIESKTEIIDSLTNRNLSYANTLSQFSGESMDSLVNGIGITG